MPRFSIIIPAYNAEPFLASAINSCRDQTFGDLEVIVVDDGSSDGTADIVRRVTATDQRVRLLTQSNQGVGPARNAGLATATGDFVNFLDADDLLEPEKLEIQSAILDANPGIGCVLCDGFVIDEKGAVIHERLVDPRRFEGHPDLFALLMGGGQFPPLVPLVRRSLALAAAGFDPDRHLSGWADTGFWMRLSLLPGADYYFVEERLVRYRRVAGNMSSDQQHMESAATAVYTRMMREQPEISARALRFLQMRINDLDRACHDLRVAVGKLASERDQLAHLAYSDLPAARAATEHYRNAAGEAERAVLASLSKSVGTRRIAIWGAGSGGVRVLALLRKFGGDADVFIDSDPTKVGTRLESLPIVAPSAVDPVHQSPFYVLVASTFFAAIETSLKASGMNAGANYHIIDFSVLSGLEREMATTA